MKLLLIISVFTSISAIKVPSIWQQQPNQNTNLNNVNRDSQPVRQPDIIAQAGPKYNNINPFINNVPNTASNGLIANENVFGILGADYDWLNSGLPNNFAFISPANQINNANFLNNINNGNEIRGKPYVQQKQGPQFQRNHNRRPVAPSNSATATYNQAPGQVPYITYTTQRPASQIAAVNTAPPQAVNIKQAYPRVNNPNTVLPITELDFSPLDPFPHSQQDGQASTQINKPNTPFSTSQPIHNLDFNLNNPFSRNPQRHQLNQFPQTSRVPINKPFHAGTDYRKPVNNPTTLRNLNFNPFTKNYRDHRTQEPTQFEPYYDAEAVPKIERLQSERAPIVKNHEYPEEVPTRPIYPGEAQWSKPGVKHRPFVSNQQYVNLEEPNKQPDGYDTFLEAQNLFENQKKQFGLKLQQLPSIDNSPTQQTAKEANTEESEIFVPTRLYAQVRHSEDEKHLPPESDENGRLKELVKDSKVQTIYSEEGYEDSAYDHAGHEKKAENTEGFESDEKNKEAKKKKKTPVKKYDRQSASYSIGDQDLKEEDIEKLKKEELNLDNEEEENEDSEPAGTHYDEQSYLNKIMPTKTKDGVKKVNALIRPKEIKTVTAKAKTGENIEMEISSEVKAVPQPNNSTEIHKYVKIYPKINKNVTANINLIEKENDTLHRGKENKLDAEKRSLTVNSHEIFIEEIIPQTTEEYISTTVTPTEFTEIVTMEIPTTTEATTSLPKSQAKKQDKPSESLERPELKLQARRKRSTVGIPTIEIDTDFIDEINHDIGKPTEKSTAPIEMKYPYYKAYKEKGIHENSPLRYAEDSKNVPKKIDGKLAFYDLADRKMACSDVNPEVDPVPDRIKNADESVEDEEEDEGNDPAAKEPRLGKLGDKIDCFKVKYFGEDPLDNPFFQEKVVGPVNPIFSEIEKISTKKIAGSDIDNVGKRPNSQSTKNELNNPLNINKEKEQLYVAASNHAIDNEIDDSLPYKSGLRSWFPGKSFGLGENTERDSKYINHFVEKNPNPKVNTELDAKKLNNDVDKIKVQNSKETAREVHTLPPLITTPKYTIQLKPKHIYDQIELLEYLPEDEFYEVKKAINAELPRLNITEVTTSLPVINKTTETALKAPIAKKRKNGKKNGERKAKVLKNEEESMKMETTDNKKPESMSDVDALQLVRTKPRKPLYEIFDINKFIPKAPKIPQNIQNSNPNYLAPISIQNPTYQVFDINKFLPTTPFPLFKDFITRSTVLPKYKVLSEVFYKDDIKPNEQLNVFTDVLKHIRSFPKLKDSFSESSEPISVKLKAEKISEEFPQNLFGNDNKGMSSTVTTIMSTFEPKVYASNHKYPQADNPLIAEQQIEDMLNEFKTGTKSKRRRRIKTTTQDTPVVIEESTSTLQFIGEPTEVMGLMPPIIQGYKTIYHPKRDSSQHISNPTIRIEERKINRYFVQGMRPPPKQKVYLYSDFLTDNHIVQRMNKPKRNKLRRSRRSAQRPAYAQVSRNNNKQPDAETEKKKEEEDDYVPQRSRNYHYDEKTGKIVYDKKPQQQSEEEEEEVEYVEVVEETPKTTEKPKQSPVFATATPPPEGQSYTDFVKLLKSASNYKEIPDPTTTEKGAEEVTQKMVASTLQPVATTAPEFLSILAKVRNDSNYKLIEDKKKTTTPKSVEEEEVEAAETESSDEESQVDNIRNSPGGQGYEAGANLEIFDISDFLPNIKSYLPKTSIDTSKYKTIERPNVRHSLSSRYNSEEDKNLQNVNTSKEPILSKSERTPTRAKQTKEQAPKQTAPIDSKATTPAPEVTSQRVIRLSRRRTTTASTIEAQNDAVSTTQATLTPNESTTAQQDKPRRNYRRRPIRIKANPTVNNSSEPVTEASKIVRRRAERDSSMDAEGNEKYEQIVEIDGNVPNQPIVMDYVDYEEPDNLNSTSAEQVDNIEKVAKKVVDVFKNYNKDQQHGGNYKKEDEIIEAEVAAPEGEDEMKEPVKDLKASSKIKNEKDKGDIAKPKDRVKTVIIKKIDLKDIKKVEVSKDYDKTKKQGENYRPANDEIQINEEDESGLERNESIQIQNVNIFQDYDKTNKHGGNYKSINNTSEEQKADIKLENPVPLKNVEVFKDYDKTKKHGGNYRSENDTTNLKSEKPVLLKNVEVFKDYDKTKKHGGNYRSENDTTNLKLENPVLLKNVEVIKDYDKTKKHGGNYRPENEDIEEQQFEESQFGSPQIRQNVLNDGAEKKSSVEVFKAYEKTKKHGGNYMRENESVDKAVTLEKQQAVDQDKDVEIFKNYDETQKTGGNYKREDESIEPKVDETHLSRSEVPAQTKRYAESRNDVQKLADVIIKPEEIYSDLKLPLDINALKIVQDLPSDELEQIVKSVEDDADDKIKKERVKGNVGTPTVVTIGNKIKVPSVLEEPVAPTKKPVFIKDPSKRLYFYAPVR